MITDYKGDAAIYKFTVIKNNIPQDITAWELIAEIGDGQNTVKKASANVAGGSDSQIKITDTVNGKFEVYQDKGETTDFDGSGYIEVATLEGGGKDTLIHEEIEFKVPEIDWETK